MKRGDKIRIELDDGIYEYGEIIDPDVDISSWSQYVKYIDQYGNEKEMHIGFVELVK